MFPTNDELFNLMILKGVTGGAVIEATATGNPLTFITDKAKPLKSLLIPFTPQQEGSGDPSPQNIRSILPCDGLTVWHGGKNLLDISKGGKGSGDWKMTFSEGKVTNSEMGSGASDYVIFSQNIKAGTYTIGFDCTSNISPRFLCTAPFQGGNYNSYYKAYYKDGKQITFTITESASVGVVFSAPNHVGETGSIFDIQLEVGQTASAYEPYHPITETDIVFPSAVYGGTLDVVSGVLTVEWAGIALNGTEANWGNYNQGTAFSVPIIGMTTDKYKTVFCDRFAQIKNITSFGVYASASNGYAYFINATDIEGVTDLASWKAYLAENPMGFAYQLATPQIIQLTPEQITALIGNNTIWSDAEGQMTAVYLKKK